MLSNKVAILKPPVGCGGLENLGDQLIAVGLESGCTADEILYLNSENEADFAYSASVARSIGRVVIAGQPQYHHYTSPANTHWTKHKLYTDYFPNINIWVVAGGAHHHVPVLEDFIKAVHSNEYCRLVYADRLNPNVRHYVRDTHAYRLLESFGEKPELVACPSVLAAKKLGIKPSKTPKYGVIVLPRIHYLNKTDPNDVIKRQFTEDLRLVKEHFDTIGLHPIVIAHTVLDIALAKKLLPSLECYYSNNLEQALLKYSEAQLVVSWRVHGAIAGYAASNANVIHIGIDSRTETLSAFKDIIKLSFWHPENQLLTALKAPQRGSNTNTINAIAAYYKVLWQEIMQ